MSHSDFYLPMRQCNIGMLDVDISNELIDFKDLWSAGCARNLLLSNRLASGPGRSALGAFEFPGVVIHDPQFPGLDIEPCTVQGQGPFLFALSHIREAA